MALDQRHVGRQFGPFRYKVGLEKMKEVAFAIAGGLPSVGWGGPVQGMNPILFDERAAQAANERAVVATPMFAISFAVEPYAAAIVDPELALDLLMLVHSEQDFEFLEVVRDGDVVTTTGVISAITEREKMDLLVVRTESKNQNGAVVVRGTWTAGIRR